MENLETTRLILRPYKMADRADNVALFTDAETMKYVGNGVLTDEEAGRMFERMFTHVYAPRAFDVWAVFDKQDGTFAGHAELKPRRDAGALSGDYEIIYVLDKKHRGRGLATELARGLLHYGFAQLNLKRIVATVDAENLASIRVLEKLGMIYEEEFEDAFGTTLVYVARAARDPDGGDDVRSDAVSS